MITNLSNFSLKKFIQFPIFQSKWILWFFYLGLVTIQCLYCIKFCQGILEIFPHFWSATESEWLVIVLTFLDMAMIANLIYMIVSGSYQSFIEKVQSAGGEKFSSGVLKVKMGTSLIVVSAINILKTFVNISHTSWDELLKQCFTHLVFMLSAWVVAHIEFMHDKIKLQEIKAELSEQNKH